jgi:hypothetical protein
VMSIVGEIILSTMWTIDVTKNIYLFAIYLRFKKILVKFAEDGDDAEICKSSVMIEK